MKSVVPIVDNIRMPGTFVIPENVVKYVFSRSSGPGGQNVNKVNTQVTAILDIHACGLFSQEQQTLILKKLTNRIDKLGQLQVTSSRHRFQHANRLDALEKMTRLILFALKKPKYRKPTKPTAIAKRKRLDQKKRRGLTKKYRSKNIPPNEY